MANPIKIYSVVSKGCIFFDGSTVQPKFLGTVQAEAHPTLNDRVIIYRTDRVSRDDSGTFRKIFRKLKISRIQNVQGEFLVEDLGYDRDQVVTYINSEANNVDVPTSGQSFAPGTEANFYRDETSTTVLFSNGDHHGVNSIKAIIKENGRVGIVTINADVELYEYDYEDIKIGGSSAGGNAQTVVNNLNALFTVSAVPSPIPSPTYDLSDVESLVWNSRETINPASSEELYGANGSSYHGARVWTTETISQPGEYFTFMARNAVSGGGALMGIGLYDAGGDDLSEILDDSLSNSGHHGYWFSNWFYNYNGYTAPWTTYGSNSGLVYGPGWNGPTTSQFRYSDTHDYFRNDGETLFRCGITNEGFVGIWYYDVDRDDGSRTNDWILCARSGTPLPAGDYGLLVKLGNTSIRITSQPGRFALEPAAPPLFYRYIESPDGQFHFPLFSSAEEANYVSADGQSHTHVYPDDSTQTAWYMPGADHSAVDLTPYSVDADGRPVNADGITWTEIVSLTDAMQVPSTFYGLPLSVNEGESVIYQTQPVDTNYVTTFSGLPAGLVDAGAGMIMGTAPQVAGDNVANPSDDFTIDVIRTNSFGSSTGQLTLTVANLTPPATLPAGFTLVSGSLNEDGSLASDSVVGIDGGLEVGKRYVVPSTWVNDNVLAQLGGSLDKAYFGVPAPDAVWGSVNFHEDFDAVMRWEWLSSSSHRSSVSVANSSNANHVSVNSATLAFYAYAIEWDGTDLSVMRAASLADVQYKHVSEFAAGEVYTESGYSNQSGTLPLVFATKTGGSMLIDTDGMIVIDAPTPPAPSILTPWNKALDFSGSSERAIQVSTSSAVNPLMMNGLAQTTSAPVSAGGTSSDGFARPWATACVFKYDGNNSNQHIWNQGEGVGGDNIYLRISANGYLYFGWGRDGSGINECSLGGSLSTDKWWGIYIAHNGTRLSGNNATAANLADCFDIYLMRLNDAGTAWSTRLGTLTDAEGNRSIASNWTQTGYRMDRSNTGGLSIGGRGANRSYNGKVASMVVTTLRRDHTMPTKAEAELMITDPKKWEDDYRVGSVVRLGNSGGTSGYQPANISSGYGATQMWLMGDGALDSYSNMIRNEVYPQDQNYTKMNLISMQSNDIQNVTIPGLSD